MSALKIEVTSTVNPVWWNDLLQRVPAGTIFQTTHWAAYWASYLGAAPQFLVVREGDRVVAQLLVLEMLKGHESLRGSIAAPLVPLLRPLLKVLTWREGPVIYDESRREEALRMCLREVQRLAKARGVTRLEEAYLPLAQPCNGMEQQVFSEFGYAMERRATVRVNVHQPLEQLWDHLEKDVARTPVRKAQRQQVVVRQLRGREGLDVFYGLVVAWRREHGFPPYAFDRYVKMASAFERHCAFFLAEHQGEALAGAGLWHFNGQAHLFPPVQSRSARQRSIYAGDYLSWEMIRWCQMQGLLIYDLSGISPAPTSEAEAGIRRFKEKWGGEVIEYPVFTQLLKPIAWNLMSYLQMMRRSLRGAGGMKRRDAGRRQPRDAVTAALT